MCREYVAEENLTLPGDQSLHPLWKIVQKHLGLSPAGAHDDDLKKILGGLASVVDGVGAFRTHVGSAHGKAIICPHCRSDLESSKALRAIQRQMQNENGGGWLGRIVVTRSPVWAESSTPHARGAAQARRARRTR